MRRWSYFFSIFIILVAIPPGVAVGVEKSPKLDVQYRWISPTGKPVRLKWKILSQWVWKKIKLKNRIYQKPSFRTFVKFPKSIRYKSGEGDNIEFIKGPDDAPFRGNNQHLIAIDSLEPTTTSTLRLYRKSRKNRKSKKKKEKLIEMGLLISDRSRNKILMIHKSCVDLGLRVQSPKKRHANGFSFLAAYCKPGKKGSIYVHFYTQANADFKSKLRSRKRKMDDGWIRYRIRKPKSKKEKLKDEAVYVGKVKVSSSRGYALYEVFYSPSEFHKLSGFAGLGATYITYSETTGTENISLGALSLTVKGGASYFFNKKLDAGVSFYANILNLMSSVTPATSPAPQFMGINARIGYTAVSKPGWTFRPMLGWYYWKMFVSDKSYGISSLLGPQLVLLNLFPASHGRKMWFYIKFAPISSNLSNFSFSSREFAGGVGYPIGSPKSKLKWALTLDISHLSIPASVTANQPSLFTITAGTQISF